MATALATPLDPSTTELAGMGSIAAVLDWVGLVDGPTDETARQGRMARTSFLEQLGSPTIMRHIVAIPYDKYISTMSEWEVPVVEGGLDDGKRAPTGVEWGHVGMVRRVGRLLFELPPDEERPLAGHAGATSARDAPAWRKTRRGKKANKDKGGGKDKSKVKGKGKGAKGKGAGKDKSAQICFRYAR